MGDLRNKARKEAQAAEIADYHRRQSDGWTVFHFDLKPSLTHRNLWLGEAARLLLKKTGIRITFRRCPLRGLTIDYRELPRSSKIYEYGERWTRLHFSQLEDPIQAKRALITDMLLQGINLFRALPNKVFDVEVERIRYLLTAPPSIGAEEWMAARALLAPQFQQLLRTHEADLRFHLLGGEYKGPTGPVAVGIGVRRDPETGLGRAL